MERVNEHSNDSSRYYFRGRDCPDSALGARLLGAGDREDEMIATLILFTLVFFVGVLVGMRMSETADEVDGWLDE